MRPAGIVALVLTVEGGMTVAAGQTPLFLARISDALQPPVVVHPLATLPPVPPVDEVPAWQAIGPIAAQSATPVVLHLAPPPQEFSPDDPGAGPLFLQILRKRQKAVGEFTFTNGDLDAHFSFEADAVTGRGQAFYSDFNDPGGQRWYRVELTALEIEGNECTFSGPVVETNVAGWEMFFIQFWATDRGKNNDGFAYECYLTSEDLPFLDPPDGEYPIDSGFIEVGK